MEFKTKMTITVDELKALIDNNSPVFILDVRPKTGREKPEIGGTVFADVYEQLKSHQKNVFSNIDLPNNVPIVAYCGAGGASMIAAEQLRENGIEAYSLEGGLNKWLAENN